jgi:uncharacterized protein YutD
MKRIGVSMKTIVLNNIEYELIKDIRNGFDSEIVIDKVTDYFIPFDYIVGDWAYGKLRLKGFYESNNKKVKKMSDIANIKDYIENKCAYGCKWFELKVSK